jgi:hypothetical protein
MEFNGAFYHVITRGKDAPPCPSSETTRCSPTWRVSWEEYPYFNLLLRRTDCSSPAPAVIGEAGLLNVAEKKWLTVKRPA